MCYFPSSCFSVVVPVLSQCFGPLTISTVGCASSTDCLRGVLIQQHLFRLSKLVCIVDVVPDIAISTLRILGHQESESQIIVVVAFPRH